MWEHTHTQLLSGEGGSEEFVEQGEGMGTMFLYFFPNRNDILISRRCVGLGEWGLEGEGKDTQGLWLLTPFNSSSGHPPAS